MVSICKCPKDLGGPKSGTQKHQIFDHFFSRPPHSTPHISGTKRRIYRQTKMLMSIYNVSPKRWPTFLDLWPRNGGDLPSLWPTLRRPLPCNHKSCDMSSKLYSIVFDSQNHSVNTRVERTVPECLAFFPTHRAGGSLVLGKITWPSHALFIRSARRRGWRLALSRPVLSSFLTVRSRDFVVGRRVRCRLIRWSIRHSTIRTAMFGVDRVITLKRYDTLRCAQITAQNQKREKN